MNAVQQSNVKRMRELGFRFNKIVPHGKSFILRNETTLLTRKTIVRDLATLEASGTIQMADPFDDEPTHR